MKRLYWLLPGLMVACISSPDKVGYGPSAYTVTNGYVRFGTNIVAFATNASQIGQCNWWRAQTNAAAKGSGWRLPSSDEFKALRPWLTTDHPFGGWQPNEYYWTSDEYDMVMARGYHASSPPFTSLRLKTQTLWVWPVCTNR